MCSGKMKERIPEGYKVVNHIATIKTVAYDVGTGKLTFNVPDKPKFFDEYLNDRIALVTYDDPEEIIKVFRDAGYTDEEIKQLYSRLDKFDKWVWNYTLPKPVKIIVPIFEWKHADEYLAEIGK